MSKDISSFSHEGKKNNNIKAIIEKYVSAVEHQFGVTDVLADKYDKRRLEALNDYNTEVSNYRSMVYGYSSLIGNLLVKSIFNAKFNEERQRLFEVTHIGSDDLRDANYSYEGLKYQSIKDFAESVNLHIDKGRIHLKPSDIGDVGEYDNDSPFLATVVFFGRKSHCVFENNKVVSKDLSLSNGVRVDSIRVHSIKISELDRNEFFISYFPNIKSVFISPKNQFYANLVPSQDNSSYYVIMSSCSDLTSDQKIEGQEVRQYNYRYVIHMCPDDQGNYYIRTIKQKSYDESILREKVNREMANYMYGASIKDRINAAIMRIVFSPEIEEEYMKRRSSPVDYYCMKDLSQYQRVMFYLGQRGISLYDIPYGRSQGSNMSLSADERRHNSLLMNIGRLAICENLFDTNVYRLLFESNLGKDILNEMQIGNVNYEKLNGFYKKLLEIQKYTGGNSIIKEYLGSRFAKCLSDFLSFYGGNAERFIMHMFPGGLTEKQKSVILGIFKNEKDGVSKKLTEEEKSVICGILENEKKHGVFEKLTEKQKSVILGILENKKDGVSKELTEEEKSVIRGILENEKKHGVSKELTEEEKKTIHLGIVKRLLKGLEDCEKQVLEMGKLKEGEEEVWGELSRLESDMFITFSDIGRTCYENYRERQEMYQAEQKEEGKFVYSYVDKGRGAVSPEGYLTPGIEEDDTENRLPSKGTVEVTGNTENKLKFLEAIDWQEKNAQKLAEIEQQYPSELPGYSTLDSRESKLTTGNKKSKSKRKAIDRSEDDYDA